jgi:nitrogen fixation-related uncharacterized protein
MAKFCSNCGAQLEEAAKFCRNCGQKQESAPQPPPRQTAQPVWQDQNMQQQPMQQPIFIPAYGEQKKKSNLPMILIIVGVALIGIGVGAFFLVKNVFFDDKKAKEEQTNETTTKKHAEIEHETKADKTEDITFTESPTIAEPPVYGPEDIPNPAYYDLGRDLVASITKIVGEREISGYDRKTENGATILKAAYLTDPKDKTQPANDVWDYFQYLMNDEGFISLVSFDVLPYEGGVDLSLAKYSVDEGQIIIVNIYYDSGGYTLEITKCEGTLTIFDEEEPAQPEATTAAPPENKTGRLSDSVFSITGSGTYHIKMKMDYGSYEIHAKNGMMSQIIDMESAETEYRMIFRDGKCYTVMDSYKMISVGEASPDQSYVPGFSEMPNLVYIGEGSGEFNGKTYKYDEYADEEDGDYFYYYFFDGAVLVGIRTIFYRVPADIIISAFDQDVPDSVFDIPADYQLYEY